MKRSAYLVQRRWFSLDICSHTKVSSRTKKKFEAIRDMPTPKSKQDLQRLLGMITYLGKYIPNLSITHGVRISVDASKFGLGAVLLQKHGDTWAPVAYASRSLSKSEQNYAQIEKEALAILFGCERFHVYLYGKSFTVESDHKPLQPIFKKPICKAPPRIQRFCLRLQKYDMHIEFKPGKELTWQRNKTKKPKLNFRSI